MYKSLCKKNTIFQILFLSVVNLLVAISFGLHMTFIVVNFLSLLLFLNLSITTFKRKILFTMNPLIWFALPVAVFTVLPSIALFVNSSIDPEIIISGYSLFIDGVLMIAFFACLSIKGLALKAFKDLNPTIRELSNTDTDYIYLKTNEPIHLAKNNFKFFYGAIEHNDSDLSVKAIKEFLNDSNKKLEDLTENDVDVIKMMSV